MFWGVIAGLLAALLVFSLISNFASFWGQRVADYEQPGQVFDMRKHLDGKMSCHGVIYGPFGRVVSRFSADMNIEWRGNTCRMYETFVYDSGEIQERSWNLSLDGRKITADATDLSGSGELASDGLRLRYRFQLPQNAGGHRLDVTDWLYLVNDGTIVNRSQFRKFGIKVAELVATIHPVKP